MPKSSKWAFSQNHIEQIFSPEVSEAEINTTCFLPGTLIAVYNFNPEDTKESINMGKMIHEQTHYHILLRMARFNLAYWIELLAFLRLLEYLNSKSNKDKLNNLSESLPEFLSEERFFPAGNDLEPYQFFIEGLTLYQNSGSEPGRDLLKNSVDTMVKANLNKKYLKAFTLFKSLVEHFRKKADTHPILEDIFTFINFYNKTSGEELLEDYREFEIEDVKDLHNLKEMFKTDMQYFLKGLFQHDLEFSFNYFKKIVNTFDVEDLKSKFEDTPDPAWVKAIDNCRKKIEKRIPQLPESSKELFNSVYKPISASLSMHLLPNKIDWPPEVRPIEYNETEGLWVDHMDHFKVAPSVFKNGFIGIPFSYPQKVPEHKSYYSKIAFNYFLSWIRFSFFRKVNNWITGELELKCPIYENLKSWFNYCPIQEKTKVSDQNCFHSSNELYVKDCKDCPFWTFVKEMFSEQNKVKVK